MAIEVTMPQLSDTMDEGKILVWNVAEGETVDRGDSLAEVATDKADLDIESFHEGVLAKIHAPAGTTVKVGEIIAVIAEAGEDVATVASSSAAPAAAPAAIASSAPVATANNGSDERIKISPLAKNLAEAHGLDYTQIPGTGEGGRIVKADIETKLGKPLSAEILEKGIESVQQAAPAYTPAPTPPAAPTPVPAGATTQPLSSMRQTIASRMVQSKTEIPHFSVTAKIIADAMMQTRASLKSLPQYEGITFNHLIIKAVALALRKVPVINAAYKDGNLVQPSQVNVGIVTALEGGLMIPVMKNADIAPLADIVAESNSMIQRARAGRPKSDDLMGGTFSISNVGRFAVESFNAIINPGQGSILAVGAIDDEAVVVDGELMIGAVMRVTLSVDHRIIDGVQAAQFVTELKELLEDPVLLLA